jgi:hypothetical protein
VARVSVGRRLPCSARPRARGGHWTPFLGNCTAA